MPNEEYPSEKGTSRSTPVAKMRSDQMGQRTGVDEGWVPEETSNRKVNLRNGTQETVGLVAGAFDFLRVTAEHDPGCFRVLFDLAQGRKVPDVPGVQAELRDAGVLAEDGTIRPLFQNVLLSACRETEEGLVLASPFAPCDEAEAQFVRDYIAMTDEILVRFARNLGYRPSGGLPDH